MQNVHLATAAANEQIAAAEVIMESGLGENSFFDSLNEMERKAVAARNLLTTQIDQATEARSTA